MTNYTFPKLFTTALLLFNAGTQADQGTAVYYASQACIACGFSIDDDFTLRVFLWER